MALFTARHIRPTIRSVAWLVAAGLAVTGPAHAAHAQLVGCRGDPVIVLSDGTELDLDAAIDDSSQDVQQVLFIVDVPRGTHVISYTPGVLGPKQILRVSANNSPATYDTLTVVDTYKRGMQVTATTQVGGNQATTPTAGQVRVGAAVASVSGQDHQDLRLHIRL